MNQAADATMGVAGTVTNAVSKKTDVLFDLKRGIAYQKRGIVYFK